MRFIPPHAGVPKFYGFFGRQRHETMANPDAYPRRSAEKITLSHTVYRLK